MSQGKDIAKKKSLFFLSKNKKQELFFCFKETLLAQTLSDDCLYKIKKQLLEKPNKIFTEGICISCGENNLSRYDYVDGCGYICVSCLYQ